MMPNNDIIMQIEIVNIEQSDEMLRRTMEHCWGVKSKMNKARIFASNDSILEVAEYWVFCKAPRSVAAQLRTHEKKHGMYFWMGTGRTDRTDRIPGEYSREQIVPFVMKLTARAIKEISHYRMCAKAEKPTREFMNLFQRKLSEIEPHLAVQMMPLCQYRGGICTEFNSCQKGNNK
jgi:hypothetical protein